MAIPTEKSIHLPLLKVISDAGGELSVSEAIKGVEAYFPELGEADKLEILQSGGKRWANRVQWARWQLVEEGYLDEKSPRGIWRITEKGKQYLESKWPDWKPEYSLSPEDDTAIEEKSIICQKAVEIIEAHPEGVRHGDLVAEIYGALPRMEPNVVSGLIYDLNQTCPDLIYKPARGVYRHVFSEKKMKKNSVRKKEPFQ